MQNFGKYHVYCCKHEKMIEAWKGDEPGVRQSVGQLLRAAVSGLFLANKDQAWHLHGVQVMG